MLILAKRMPQLRFSDLASLYEADTLQAEQDLYAYLQEDLFPRGLCCIWEENGRYVSALRLQPWKDGWLLEGLQTQRDHRGKGYAKALLDAVLEATQYDKIYAHIRRTNAFIFKIIHAKTTPFRFANWPAVTMISLVN